MADIRPFPGIRPRPDLAAEVAAPPYDVIDRKEALDLIRTNPRSFMRVIRPDVELAADIDRADPRVAAHGRQVFEAMLGDGTLRRDTGPSFYVYELTMNDHVQTGVVAGASLDEYDRGVIKRHEKTRAAALEGRTRHIKVLGANTGPVMLTYRSRPEIDAYLVRMRNRPPIYDFKTAAGVRHRFWVVDAATDVEQLQDLFVSVPSLYIADGHHRTAAADIVRRQRRENGRVELQPGDHACDYFLAVLFPHDQLHILGYNRVVRDLNGQSPEQLKTAIAESFAIEPAQSPLPEHAGSFGMFLEGQWYRLVARRGSFPEHDVERVLDVSILQENLLAPILGIEHPRRDPRLDFVGGVRGTGELERRATACGGVAFALFPVAIEQVMAIADQNRVMPPKSTWFEPKLCSGLIVRSICPSHQSSAVDPLPSLVPLPRASDAQDVDQDAAQMRTAVR